MTRSRRYNVENIADTDYTDTLALLENTSSQAESLLHSLEQAAGDIGFYMNSDKTEFMCFNQDVTISSLNSKPLKLVDLLIYLGSNILSTESDVSKYICKAWTAFDRLSTVWKSDLSDKIKREIFQAVAGSIELYGCTTQTLTKDLEKKLDGNYTKMQRAVMNESCK